MLNTGDYIMASPKDTQVLEQLNDVMAQSASDDERQALALKTRIEASLNAYRRPEGKSQNNGEEYQYRNDDGQRTYIANFTKGLQHNEFGEVIPEQYETLLHAVETRDSQAFKEIPRFGGRPLVNPQAGLAFSLQGPDGHAVKTRSKGGHPISIRPAPRIDTPEVSAEMAELYWMALLRDTNFTEFERSALAKKAAESLSKFSDFRGPKDHGNVTPRNLFRGFTQGDIRGPYISQFLVKGNTSSEDDTGKDGKIKYGSLTIDLRQRTVEAGSDWMMSDFKYWLAVQNGNDTKEKDKFDEEARRFIRNPRDLANYVHFDQLHQAYFNACLFLLSERYLEFVPLRDKPLTLDQRSPEGEGFEFPFTDGNPYKGLDNQEGFGTFGAPHILSLVSEVSTRALKAVWYEKWFVHRRLRPEEFGGRIHVHLDDDNDVRYPIDSEIIESLTHGHLSHHFGPNADADKRFENYLLPQVFPEGSPMHPAYGAGHATVAGACVTVLKAWFDEGQVIQNPLVPTEDGTELTEYQGSDKLTVGGELNKLAANISLGRNMAGVHWRSDHDESLLLGEAVAINLMQEQFLTFNEKRSDGSPPFFELTKFDGHRIKIDAEGVTEL